MRAGRGSRAGRLKLGAWKLIAMEECAHERSNHGRGDVGPIPRIGADKSTARAAAGCAGKVGEQ